MWKSIARRAAMSLVALTGVVVLVFFMIHAIPGDPVDNLLGEQVQAADKEAFRRRLHLDEGLGSQFARYVGHLADGTLGRSYLDPSVTVRGRIAEVLPHTLQLAVCAMLFALLVAIPLGVIAALRHRTWADTTAMMLAVTGVSLPAVWIGPLLIYLFTVKLPWLPPPGALDQDWRALVLPSITLGLALSAMLARMTRGQLVRVLGEDYIRTARAKGLSTFRVVVVHGLRNALIPVATVAGMQFGALLSGAVIVEKIYARPGLGTLLLRAITQRDYPVVQGTVLVVAVLVVVVTQLTDLLYAAIDPRLRGGGRT